jgi:D-ribose pyranase
MKKVGVLNQDMSYVIAGMGHMDKLVVADAGFPVPPGVRRIDLAVRKGLPTVLEVVEVIATEMRVERVILAREMEPSSPGTKARLLEILANPEVETTSHDKLKELSRSAVAVIRTGECTPYVNVILVSGVAF